MKTNFAERTKNAVDSLAFPAEINSSELKRFSTQLHHALALVAKTSSDNRYLAVFYKNEFSKLASIMKRLGALADELTREIGEKEKEARKFVEPAAEVNEIQAKEEKKKLLEREAAALEEEMLGSKSASEAEEQAREAQEKTVAVQEKILGCLNPLARSLRKLEKTLPDKQESALASAYCKNPLQALFGEPRGHPGLKKLLEKLCGELGRGSLEESGRDREKILKAANAILQGCLESLVEEALEAEEEKKRRQAALGEAQENATWLKEVEEKIVEVRSKRRKVLRDAQVAGKHRSGFSRLRKKFAQQEKKIVVMLH